jgi:hypothetical protein
VVHIIRPLRLGASRARTWYTGWSKGIAIERAGLPPKGIHVYYGHDRLPAPGEVAHGGIIKFQRLSETYPNTPRRFNILYMVSSNYPAHAVHMVRAARRKGARFVWNQDGGVDAFRLAKGKCRNVAPSSKRGLRVLSE